MLNLLVLVNSDFSSTQENAYDVVSNLFCPGVLSFQWSPPPRAAFSFVLFFARTLSVAPFIKPGVKAVFATKPPRSPGLRIMSNVFLLARVASRGYF